MKRNLAGFCRVLLKRKQAFLHHVRGKQNHSLVPCETPTLSIFDAAVEEGAQCKLRPALQKRLIIYYLQAAV